jgi:hypothetical protein
MLRIVGIIFDIIVIVALLLAGLTLLYIFAATSGAPFPDDFIHLLRHLLMPFLVIIRKSFGIHLAEFSGKPFETNYLVLLVFMIAVFVLALRMSTFFYTLDYQVKKMARQAWNGVWNLKKKMNQKYAPVTSLGNPYYPEACVITVINLDNLERYRRLKEEMTQVLNSLPPSQFIFSQGNRFMLKFPQTVDAVYYLQRFCSQFAKSFKTTPLQIDFLPTYRIAIHSLKNESELFSEEGFIWAMLQCIAVNQIVVSAAAKEHLDMQCKDFAEGKPFTTVDMGTFSHLGNRTFADVYRLEFSAPGLDNIA